MEIKKVLLRVDGVKYIIIPRNSDLKKGDCVKIIKMEEEDGRERKN